MEQYDWSIYALSGFFLKFDCPCGHQGSHLIAGHDQTGPNVTNGCNLGYWSLQNPSSPPSHILIHYPSIVDPKQNQHNVTDYYCFKMSITIDFMVLLYHSNIGVLWWTPSTFACAHKYYPIEAIQNLQSSISFVEKLALIIFIINQWDNIWKLIVWIKIHIILPN